MCVCVCVCVLVCVFVCVVLCCVVTFDPETWCVAFSTLEVGGALTTFSHYLLSHIDYPFNVFSASFTSPLNFDVLPGKIVVGAK